MPTSTALVSISKSNTKSNSIPKAMAKALHQEAIMTNQIRAAELRAAQTSHTREVFVARMQLQLFVKALIERTDAADNARIYALLNEAREEAAQKGMGLELNTFSASAQAAPDHHIYRNKDVASGVPSSWSRDHKWMLRRLEPNDYLRITSSHPMDLKEIEEKLKRDYPDRYDDFKRRLKPTPGRVNGRNVMDQVDHMRYCSEEAEEWDRMSLEQRAPYNAQAEEENLRRRAAAQYNADKVNKWSEMLWKRDVEAAFLKVYHPLAFRYFAEEPLDSDSSSDEEE